MAKAMTPAKPTTVEDALRLVRESKRRERAARDTCEELDPQRLAAGREMDAATAWRRQAEAWLIEMAGKD